MRPGTTRGTLPGLGRPWAHPLVRAAVLALLAALAASGGRARAAERTASWSIGRLEVVSKGVPKRMVQGTMIDGYTLRAPAKARGDAPVGDGVLILQLSTFSPAKDLPQQPKGLYYVKGIWRIVAGGAADPGPGRGGPGILQGTITAALPSDPTAGEGGFTLRTKITPGANRGIRAGDGALTVDRERAADLTLTYR